MQFKSPKSASPYVQCNLWLCLVHTNLLPIQFCYVKNACVFCVCVCVVVCVDGVKMLLYRKKFITYRTSLLRRISRVMIIIVTFCYISCIMTSNIIEFKIISPHILITKHYDIKHIILVPSDHIIKIIS